MLEKLQLVNFQRHTKTTLTLDPHITTITGKSDSGKSAIIRALRWLLLNKPRGNRFIRDGQKNCTVRLLVDGQTVVRAKVGDHLYRFGKQEFKTVARDGMPEQLQQFLQVSELNFQTQHNALFWLDLTPSQVSKEINKLVDMELADRCVRAVAKELREHKATIKVLVSQQQEAKDKAKELKWVPTCQKLHAKTESLQLSAKRLRQRSEDLKALLEQIEATTKRLGRLEHMIGKVSPLRKQCQELVADRRTIETGSNIINGIEHTKDKLDKIPDVSQLRKRCQAFQVERDKWFQLVDVTTTIERAEKGIHLTDKRIEALRKRQKKLNKGICPTCRRPLP